MTARDRMGSPSRPFAGRRTLLPFSAFIGEALQFDWLTVLTD
jgi:hypothetical protein